MGRAVRKHLGWSTSGSWSGSVSLSRWYLCVFILLNFTAWYHCDENFWNQEHRVLSLGSKDPLEKGMAIHSSILRWRIPWTEEPGGLQPTWLKRFSTRAHAHAMIQLTSLSKEKELTRREGIHTKHSRRPPICDLSGQGLALTPLQLLDPSSQAAPAVTRERSWSPRCTSLPLWQQGLNSSSPNSQAGLVGTTGPPFSPQATELGSHTHLYRIIQALLSKNISHTTVEPFLLINPTFVPPTVLKDTHLREVCSFSVCRKTAFKSRTQLNTF